MGSHRAERGKKKERKELTKKIVLSLVVLMGPQTQGITQESCRESIHWIGMKILKLRNLGHF
jgi:uncharacterized membrane protein